MSIKTARSGSTRRFLQRGDARGLPARHVRRIAAILKDLDDAAAPSDMNDPTYRLHPLKGKHKGYWSVRVSRRWRIVA